MYFFDFALLSMPVVFKLVIVCRKHSPDVPRSFEYDNKYRKQLIHIGNTIVGDEVWRTCFSSKFSFRYNRQYHEYYSKKVFSCDMVTRMILVDSALYVMKNFQMKQWFLLNLNDIFLSSIHIWSTKI